MKIKDVMKEVTAEEADSVNKRSMSGDTKSFRGTANRLPTSDTSNLGDITKKAKQVDMPNDTIDDFDFSGVDGAKLKKVVARLVSELPGSPKNIKVLQARFGLAPFEKAYTLQQIADAMGVTKSVVAQREAKAIRMLKHPDRSRELRPFLEAELNEVAPAVAAVIWILKWAVRYGAWPVLKWLLKKHGGKIIGGAAAAYYIDQGWDWVISQIGEEYAQMLIDNKFEIGIAVALILGAVALKKFIENKGEALVSKYQKEGIIETTSAGAIAGVAGTGFASGGIGTMIRRKSTPKKKKNK